MPGTYFELYIHIFWAVKNRDPFLTPDIETSIIDIIKAKTEKHKTKLLALGNTTDHIHVLVSIHPETVISALIQEMKGASSYFLNHNLGKNFYWQEGYGALSVSKSALEIVREYVQNQKIHHAQKTTIQLFEDFGEKDLDSKKQ
jgi:putative transposase